LSDNHEHPSQFLDEKKLTYRLLLKAVLAISSLFVIVLFVAGFIIDRRYSEQKRLEMNQEVDHITSVFESIMLDPTERKEERAQSYFEKVGSDTIFNALRMVSLDTTVVFSKDPSEIGEKLNLLSIPDCKTCQSLHSGTSERELIAMPHRLSEAPRHACSRLFSSAVGSRHIQHARQSPYDIRRAPDCHNDLRLFSAAAAGV
jgi:hypothetical protein